MNIAIIGSGISGLVAAYHLSTEHQITLFEANDYVGGHTHTHKISLNQREYAIDTGFIVFNDWTYPNFIRLMEELGVQSQPSHMSFSVKCEKTGLEYNGTTLNALFAQRLNLVRPSFLRMVADILPTPVSYWSADRRCLFANLRYAQRYQCKPEDLIVFNYAAMGNDLLEDGLYALQDKLQDPAFKDRMVRFVRASMKGWQYAVANPEEAAEIVAGDQQDVGSRGHVGLPSDT